MAKTKTDTSGLFWAVIVLALIGALYYFGYTTHWGAQLLNAFGILMLFWAFLSPLYVLIRMGMVAVRRRKAARLGLTYGEFEAQRRAKRGLTSSASAGGKSHDQLQRWGRRLLRVKRGELIVFTALLLLFAAAAERWRQAPGEHVKVTALGMFYALTLYTFLGLQLLHRVWAHWHHRLAPGSAAPADAAPDEKLSRGQIFWSISCLLALVFAVAELSWSGEGEMLAMLGTFLAPALLLLLLASVRRMLRPLLRHRHAGSI